jgi:competence protein ComEA
VPELSRSQLVVYGLVAVAVLLVGARWIRSDRGGSDAPALSFAAGGPGTAHGGGDVFVHVAGAVARPGVYLLPPGARVTDAVKRAGGFARGADRDAINLAARLGDGQQVVVPGRSAAGSADEGGGPISLGTATVDELDEIEGIGPVTAQDIVEFRDEHGGISSVEQLDQISGIGPATMEALRSSLQP